MSIKNLYKIRGYYYDDKLGIWQIIDNGLFADSVEAALYDALEHFNRLSNGKARICSVEPWPEDF